MYKDTTISTNADSPASTLYEITREANMLRLCTGQEVSREVRTVWDCICIGSSMTPPVVHLGMEVMAACTTLHNHRSERSHRAAATACRATGNNAAPQKSHPCVHALARVRVRVREHAYMSQAPILPLQLHALLSVSLSIHMLFDC